MGKTWLKLPLLTLLGGVIIRITTRITVSALIGGGNQWTSEMGATQSYISIVINIVIVAAIGIYLRKRYDRRFLAKSATILVVYSVLILVWEQVAQSHGTYPLIIYYLYLPVELFTVITSLVIKLSTAEQINWVYAVPSLFAPYLFVLFGKRHGKKEESMQ